MSNGIEFLRLVLKNFLSFSNTPTELDLRGNHITAVLGLNHDTGGDESRNGVGKSAIIDSICYALYGKTIRGISNAKLVNKMARKGQGMLVTLEFTCPSGFYRIERGEAPSKLRLFRKELDDPNDILSRDGKTFVYDVSRNKAETTAEIERIIGFDIKLFEFLIANTSESIPFMKLDEAKKRDIAERLMGLNLLTERAEELKEDRKSKKRDLVAQESAVEATQQANRRVQQQLDVLKGKEEAWEESRNADMAKLRAAIEELSNVDLNEQTELLTIMNELETEISRISNDRREASLILKAAKKEVADLDREVTRLTKEQNDLTSNRATIIDGKCPTCAQSWVPDPSVIEEIDHRLEDIDDLMGAAADTAVAAESSVKDAEAVIAQLDADENEVDKTAEELSGFDILFDSLTELGTVEQKLTNDRNMLAELEASVNPHSETINELQENAVQVINYDELHDLRDLIDHYNYLIDLLQSKDSFLRKAVIDRWLPQLNGRIAHYLSVLELPYVVRIENDLGMSIKDFGEDFDWGNLSKGQRQRVTIALNLAYQDVFEATNHPISLLLVDELIDSGICARGATQAVRALRDACENKNKRVFLITHRDDITDQVGDTMVVEMRNRISKIADPYEDEDHLTPDE